MGSEIQNERNRQAQELRDLQDTYRKKKQQLEQEGEANLARAREQNQKELATENQNNSAAINHVRSATKDIVDQMREEAERKITYERKNLAGRQASTVDNAEQQLSQLRETYSHKKNDLRDAVEDTKRKEELARKAETSVTQQIQNEQMQRRNEITQTVRDDLAHFHKQVQQEKANLNRQSKQEIMQTQEENAAHIGQLKSEHKNIYDKQRKWGQSQLEQQRSDHDVRYETQRKQFLKEQTDMKNRAFFAIDKERKTHEQQFNEMVHKDIEEVERERAKGNQSMEETRNYYATEVERTHRRGDAAIREQQEIFKAKSELVEREELDETNKMKAMHEDQMKQRQSVFEKKAAENEIFYKEALVSQNKEFQEAHKKNQENFTNSLRAQKEAFAQGVLQEKREVMKNLGKHHDRLADPFYQIQYTGTTLDETPDHYIIKAAVPEHEKDNVKLFVKNGIAVVQGQRNFADEVKTEDVKMATNSYQTFRQEIPLSHPVREKYATRHWNDGVLVLKIPKA